MFSDLQVSIHGSGVEVLVDYVKKKMERVPETLNHFSK